jgi:hypothetical protein
VLQEGGLALPSFTRHDDPVGDSVPQWASE